MQPTKEQKLRVKKIKVGDFAKYQGSEVHGGNWGTRAGIEQGLLRPLGIVNK